MDLPLACSLTPADQADRADEFRELAARALAGRRREPGRVVLSFRAETGVAPRLEDLARRERDCCPFLDLSVDSRDGLVELSIAAPADAQPALDAFYGLVG